MGQMEKSWVKAGVREAYREMLFEEGREVRSEDGEEVVRRGVRAGEAEAVRQSRGKLSPGELARSKVRHFSFGAVLGTKEFVNQFFEANRRLFGPKRKNGARPVRQSAVELHALRDLR